MEGGRRRGKRQEAERGRSELRVRGEGTSDWRPEGINNSLHCMFMPNVDDLGLR